jgi:hypothetical protein
MFAKVFKCFHVFFQVFQKHVASVFQMFSVVFHKYVVSVYPNVEYVVMPKHMLQAYVLNVLFVLDVCCSKSYMLQVFHEAHAVPTGRASVRRVQ